MLLCQCTARASALPVLVLCQCTSLPLCQCIQVKHSCFQNAAPAVQANNSIRSNISPININIFVCSQIVQLLWYLVCIFAGNWTCLSSAEHQQKSNFIVQYEHQIQICPFHALSYFNQKQVQLMQILYSGAGARTYPFSHYYIHEDGRTFSSSKHTRAIQPMIKRKNANCRCISRRWSFFSSLQRPKKDLLCTYPIASITLTWQFDQRDNFLRGKELLFAIHQWPAECSSPEAESNLVFPQDLVRVVKLLELGQEVDLRR